MEENFVGKWLFVCDGIMWVRGLGYWLGLKGRRGEIWWFGVGHGLGNVGQFVF